jgi:hypothetical protein
MNFAKLRYNAKAIASITLAGCFLVLFALCSIAALVLPAFLIYVTIS